MRILLTGSSGMLGSAILRALQEKDPEVEVYSPSSRELNLLDANQVNQEFGRFRPELVVHCAANVGGIQANVENPFSYFFPNVQMDTNLIHAARTNEVASLIYFASSCMYPANSIQPISESELLTGALEKTNEGYAVAKSVATKLIAAAAIQFDLDWHVFTLSNLYGPGDKYSEANSHLVAAVIKKIDSALQSGTKSIEMWGDGLAKRDFVFVEDVASFIVGKIGETKSLPPMMNLGSKEDFTVKSYYGKIAEIMGFAGEIIALPDKPVGMNRRFMDSRLAVSHGWNPTTDRETGLLKTIEHYRRMTR